jgi:hypothetical protein
MCMPAILTFAIFIALLILDLIRREFSLLLGHSLFGIVSVLLMNVLCQNNASLAAWGLLALPFILLILGDMMYNNEIERRQAAVAAKPPEPTLMHKPCPPKKPSYYL